MVTQAELQSRFNAQQIQQIKATQIELDDESWEMLVNLNSRRSFPEALRQWQRLIRANIGGVVTNIRSPQVVFNPALSNLQNMDKFASSCPCFTVESWRRFAAGHLSRDSAKSRIAHAKRRGVIVAVEGSRGFYRKATNEEKAKVLTRVETEKKAWRQGLNDNAKRLVLEFIKEHPGTMIGPICEQLEYTSSYINNLIYSLIEDELVETTRYHQRRQMWPHGEAPKTEPTPLLDAIRKNPGTHTAIEL